MKDVPGRRRRDGPRRGSNFAMRCAPRAHGGHHTRLLAGLGPSHCASHAVGLRLAQEYLKQGWSVVGPVRGTKGKGLHDVADRSGEVLEIETLGGFKAQTIGSPLRVAHVRLKSVISRRDGDCYTFLNLAIASSP